VAAVIVKKRDAPLIENLSNSVSGIPGIYPEFPGHAALAIVQELMTKGSLLSADSVERGWVLYW